LSRVDHVWKVRDRKQRTDIGKYSFVNRTIKNWNQGLSLVNLKFLETGLGSKRNTSVAKIVKKSSEVK